MKHAVRKVRVLLVAEAVTLAHVGRVIALASTLNPDTHEILLAFDPRFDKFLGNVPFNRVFIKSISSEHFLKCLEQGRNPYDFKTLKSYVDEDCKIMEEFKPDLVVGDFRLSLVVSSKLKKVPYVNMVNAHFSSFASPRWTGPTHTLTKLFGSLGRAFVQFTFEYLRPLIFGIFSMPFNKFLKHYGQPTIGADFVKLYSAGDFVVHPDMEEIVPTPGHSSSHVYLGPITWAPSVNLPTWWNQITKVQNEAVVFLSLGSSGNDERLPAIIKELSKMPVKIVATTLGKANISDLPSNVFISPFIPISEALKDADVVICNGGSGTVNEAIKTGVPVLGLANNLDQYLTMGYFEKTGAGKRLRGDLATAEEVVAATLQLLNAPNFHKKAQELKVLSKKYNSEKIFQKLVWDICAKQEVGLHTKKFSAQELLVMAPDQVIQPRERRTSVSLLASIGQVKIKITNVSLSGLRLAPNSETLVLGAVVELDVQVGDMARLCLKVKPVWERDGIIGCQVVNAPVTWVSYVSDLNSENTPSL